MNSELSRKAIQTTMATKPVQEALGQAESFLEFQERLSRVAPVHRPVLLVGERGSGKELAATRLHYLSHRWQGSFVALNCAALSPSLIESELFGYEKGAFTGAQTRRRGRFETAHEGTLFLDEIGTIPLEVQEKILRVVEYNTFERVGGTQPIDVDVRIVAATNAHLPQLVRENRFKPDLLDRLSFEVLFLPPLRQRREDIMLLAAHFAARMTFEMGREEIPPFTADAIHALERYRWPGNIRELKNVVERAVYRTDPGEPISEVVFDPFRPPWEVVPPAGDETPGQQSAGHPAESAGIRLGYKEALERFQRHMLLEALEKARFNQKKAARLLGLTYDQFRGLYRRFKKELAGP